MKRKRDAHIEMKKYFEEKRKMLATGSADDEDDHLADKSALPKTPAPTPCLTLCDLPAGTSSLPDDFTTVTGTNGKSYLIQTEILKKI